MSRDPCLLIPEASSRVLHSEIRRSVKPNSTIHTDEWRGYNNLRGYRRVFVKHGAGEYVNGSVTTNGIESFWAIVKKGYRGVYHFWSPKHIQRYLEEYTFRFNHKALGFAGMFEKLLKISSESSKLSFQELTA